MRERLLLGEKKKSGRVESEKKETKENRLVPKATAAAKENSLKFIYRLLRASRRQKRENENERESSRETSGEERERK